MIQMLVTLLPTFVCGILSVELFFSWRKNYMPAKLWLLIWAISATLLYSGHFVYFCRFISLLPLSDSIYTTCNLAVYPLYLIYIYKLTELRTPRLLLALLVLPILVGCSAATLYAVMNPDEMALFVNSYLYHEASRGTVTPIVTAQKLLHDFCKIAFSLELLLVVFVGRRKIKKYNSMVEQLYADTEERSLHSINIILLLLIITSLVSFVINIIGRTWFSDHYAFLIFPSLTFSALLFAIGWCGLNQDFSIIDIYKDREAFSNYKENNFLTDVPKQPYMVSVGEDLSIGDFFTDSESIAELPSEKLEPLREQLVEVVEKKQIFRQHDLKLDELANILGTNRTYLLKVMHDGMGMSFSEYINRCRIAYALELMSKCPDISKTEIAYRSGFSSKSSFYRNLRLYS